MTAESGTGHLDVTGDIVILTVDLHGAQLLDTLLRQGGSLTQEVLILYCLSTLCRRTMNLVEKMALKKVLSKIHGTDIEKLLKEYQVI